MNRSRPSRSTRRRSRRRQRRLSHDAVAEPNVRMGDRKIRIDLGRTLEERLGPYPARRHERFPCGAVGLQRFKRRGCRLLERCRVFLDGGERFTNLRPKTDRNVTQRARTSSFRAACACSSARMSPVVQFFARRPRTTDCRASQSTLPGRPRSRSGRIPPARSPESIAHPPARSSTAAFFGCVDRTRG